MTGTFRQRLSIAIAALGAVAAFGFSSPAFANTTTVDSCHDHDPGNAVTCTGGTSWCGNTCQASPTPTATQDVNCSSCATVCAPATPCGYPACTAPSSAPAGTVSCSGNGSCPANGGVYTDQCSTSFGCPTGKTRCTSPNSCATTLSCPAGFTFDPCANGGLGACTSPYVVLSPGAQQSGFITVSGNVTTGGDLYMANGKAIRADGSGVTTLNFGNWGGGATGLDANIYGRLKVDGTAGELTINRASNSFVNRMLFSTGGTNEWQIGQGIAGVTGAFSIKHISSPPDVGTTSIYIDAADNVALGNVQNPSSTLDINGAITMREIGVPAVSSANQGRIYFDPSTDKFKISENGAAYANLLGLTGSGTSGQLAWWNGASSITGNANLNWDNTNVRLGVGVSSPNSTLQVKRGLNSDFITSGLTGNFAARVTNTTSTADENGLLVATGRGGNPDNWIFAAGWDNVATGVYTDYFRIRGDGNVGIGTTSPGALLELKNDNSIKAILSGTSLHQAFINFQGISGNTDYKVGKSTATDFAILQGPGNTDVFHIDSAGKIGIGVLAPAQKLDVAGNIGLSGDLRSSDDTFTLTTFTPGFSRNRMEVTESEIRVGRYLDNMDANSFGISAFTIEGSENSSAGTFDIATLGFSNDSNRAGQTNALIASITAYTDAAEGANTGWLKFRTKDGASLVDRMSITSSGNVGVGVTPAAGVKFDVAGTAQMTGFKMPTGAAVGRILTSDAAGAGTWMAPASAPVSSVAGSGAGISVSPTTGAVIVSNTGVTSLVAGTGISVSSATGAVTVTNAGITGSGAANNVPRFITATTLGNSSITNDGSNTSIGSGSVASGGNSAAIGWDAITSYAGSYAIGLRARTNSYYSVAIGQDATAGIGATPGGNHAFGIGANASAGFSTALGSFANASGAYSTALGMYVTASGTGSIAIGHGYGTTLVNSNSYSLGVGFNSNIPTFFVGTAAGNGTTGNVGIGNSAPNYKLTVSGDVYANGGWMRVSGNQGLYFESWGGGWYMEDSSWIRSYNDKPVYMSAGFDTASVGGVGCGGGMGGGYNFRVCGSTNITGGLTMNAGTTLYSPGRMHVDGEELLYILNQSGVMIGKEWGGTGNLQVQGSGGFGGEAPSSSYGLRASGPTYGGYFVDTNYGGDAYLGYGSGGVRGTGYTWGGYFYETDTGAAGYIGYANYDFYAGGSGVDWGSSSSIRWKKNLEPIADPIGKVKALQGLYFDWDQEHGGGRHDIGMIAEDVGKVLPEIVGFDETAPGYARAMDYSRLTPLLVEAVKAQQVQIEAMQKEIDDLKSR